MKKTSLFSIKTIVILTMSVNTVQASSHFPLIMENHSEQNAWLNFQENVGHVYFDIPFEQNSLLFPGDSSNIYGVNFAPNDPKSSFNIIFKKEDQHECTFTVGYYTPPEEPHVTFSGDGCGTAGYKINYSDAYLPLILFV